MSLDPLVELVHSVQQGEWGERNEDAFKALFGSPRRRYPKAAEKSVTLRAPDESRFGSTFRCLYSPGKSHKGAYGGFSFVIFPAEGRRVLLGLLWVHRGSP